nr:DUF2194 domain-containing protein [uncultured Blautia sp.]
MSYKRIVPILCITLVVSAIFFLYNRNESLSQQIESRNEIPVEEALISGEGKALSQELSFLVIGKESKIKKNIIELFEQTKLTYRNVEYAKRSELTEGRILIFCGEEIEKLVDLKDLAQYIETGGKVILAAGLAEGYTDSYLQPVLGILEKSVKENYNNLVFEEGFFCNFSGAMSYDGYTVSTWIKTDEKTEIYGWTQEKKVPIVYTYPYGKGETLVINTNMLEDKACMGILTAGIGTLVDYFIYPAFGTKLVYLDNFPLVTYSNDSTCMKLYGRTTENFVMGVVWPVFQGIAVRENIRYTSGILAASTEGKDFPEINSSLFYSMGKSAVQFGGEVIITGELGKKETLYFNDRFLGDFKEKFPNYRINGLAVSGERPTKENIERIKDKVETVSAVRLRLDAERDGTESPFLWNQEYYTFPLMTEGLSLEGKNRFEIASMLTAYGAVSHQFDINEFISVSEEEDYWDENSRIMEDYEKEIFSRCDFLEPKTLSQMENKAKSYHELEYGYEAKGETLVIQMKNFVKGQKLLLNTKKKIKSMTGGSWEKAGEGYWLLDVEEPRMILVWE